MLEPRSPTARAPTGAWGVFVSVTETVTQTRHRCFVLVDTIGAEGGTCSESFLGVTGVNWPTRRSYRMCVPSLPKPESETYLRSVTAFNHMSLVPVIWHVQIVLRLPSNEYTNTSWCTGEPNGSSEWPGHAPTSVVCNTDKRVTCRLQSALPRHQQPVCC